jgi:tetratricopeptide (TPR) repeat protein
MRDGGTLRAAWGLPKSRRGFRRTLQLQPDLAKAHYMLGLSLVANPKSKLDWPAAITEFRAALRIQHDYPEASTYLGVALTAIGQTDLAISELEHAVRMVPLLPSAHFNLAIALENGNRLEDAVKQYRERRSRQKGATRRQAVHWVSSYYAWAGERLVSLIRRLGYSAMERLPNTLRRFLRNFIRQIFHLRSFVSSSHLP